MFTFCLCFVNCRYMSFSYFSAGRLKSIVVNSILISTWWDHYTYMYILLRTPSPSYDWKENPPSTQSFNLWIQYGKLSRHCYKPPWHKHCVALTLYHFQSESSILFEQIYNLLNKHKVLFMSEYFSTQTPVLHICWHIFVFVLYIFLHGIIFKTSLAYK